MGPETRTETAAADRALRALVACPRCRAQYDAGDRAAGSVFHCSCGELLEVRRPAARDAAVVRCSACGAPRQEGRDACGFCGSDFTLRERDLHTLCPRCATRISDRARFCHACALPIAPQGGAGEATGRRCPTCEPERPLFRRPIDGDLSALECQCCAGLWIAREVFRTLEERALAREIPASPARVAAPRPAQTIAEQRGPAYRACPLCAARMNRVNYGRKSGIVVDACAAHGLWFDHRELAAVLSWIEEGGAARTRDAERREHEERLRRQGSPLLQLPDPTPRTGAGAGMAFLGWLVERLNR